MTNIIKKLVKDLDENEGITLGNDVLPYMEKAIQQAIAEERKRVVREITPLIEEIGSGAFSRDPVTHAENVITRAKEIGQEILTVLSSLDKPLTENKE